LIPVNYAKADSLMLQIKDSLTERGTVSVDARTNTLIVKDVQEALLRAEGIVRNLDTQTLSPDRGPHRGGRDQLLPPGGHPVGGNVIMAPTYGNPTGLIFPTPRGGRAADDPAAPSPASRA